MENFENIENKKSVILVEDDENLTYVISRYLKNEGYSASSFSNGTSFIKHLAKSENYPDLVILDNMLPDFNGKSIIESLNEKNISLPFIIMTGRGSEKTAVEMFKLGAKDYIIKDVSFIEHLLASVNRFFRQKQIEEDLEKSNRELEETRQRIHNFFQSSIDAIFVTSMDGVFLAFNQTFLNLFGYSKDELLQLPVEALYLNNKDRIRYIDLIKAQGYLKDYRIKLKKKNGSIFEAVIRATPTVGEDSEITGIQGVIRDLSEQIESEKALRMSEDRWKFALEGSGDGVWDWDSASNKVFRSRRWKEMLGYSVNEISDSIEELKELIHPDDSDLINNELMKNSSGESSVFINEYRLKCKDGSYKWILDRGKVIEWSGDKPKRIIGTHTDITARKNFEKQLEESEEKFRSIVQNSTDGIVLTDETGKIVVWNNGIEKITGYTEKESLGRPIDDIIFKMMTPEYKSIEAFDRIKKSITNAYDIGNFRTSNKLNEYGIICKSGEKKDIQQVLFSIPSNKGFKLCSIQRDISDLKTAQEEIKKMNVELEFRVAERTKQLSTTLSELENEIITRKEIEEQLNSAKDEISMALEKEKELNKLKTRFISMISHEYRTPLTIISTSAYILDKMYKGDEPEKFKSQVERINSSIESMTKLLEDVLNVSASDSLKIITEFRTIDLIDVINCSIHEIQLSNKLNHSFGLISPSESVKISTDEKLLRQIVSNLISNAVKFSPANSEIQISLKESANELSISVIDHGVGILKEERDKIFDTFFRGTNIGVVPGAGLGLSILKRCIDALNGQVFIDSEPGKGSKFTVIIPK